jgi:hypothetical protein
MIFIGETIKNINRYSSKTETFVLQIFWSIDEGPSDNTEPIPGQNVYIGSCLIPIIFGPESVS